MKVRFGAAILVWLCSVYCSLAQALVQVTVAGNTANARISIGSLELAELNLTFDNVSNLTASNLGISVDLVSLLNPVLRSRLGGGSNLQLPAALPLLITVEPTVAGNLTMNNTVRVEIHTDLLPYTAGTRLRLFKAPLGGAFSDITDEVAPGSVRTRGTTGGFSQFLILLDLRPTAWVIDGKDTQLRTLTATLATSDRNALDAFLDQAETAVNTGQFATALVALDQFRAYVSGHAGGSIPNTWTPSATAGNPAGALLAGAASLKFSIAYLRDYGN